MIRPDTISSGGGRPRRQETSFQPKLVGQSRNSTIDSTIPPDTSIIPRARKWETGTYGWWNEERSIADGGCSHAVLDPEVLIGIIGSKIFGPSQPSSKLHFCAFQGQVWRGQHGRVTSFTVLGGLSTEWAPCHGDGRPQFSPNWA